MRTKLGSCARVLVLAAFVWGAAAAAGPYESPPRPAADMPPAAAPEEPQDRVHQCRLGCAESCKAFANPGLQQQCLDSCYAKCTATYEP